MSGILAGGIIGSSIIGAGSTRRQNEANQDYATQMASTQYQRAVEDMRAAGINPVMAAGNGGASAPVVQGTAPGAQVANNLANAAKVMAVDIPQAKANISQQEANTKVADQVAKRTVEETELTKANRRATLANAKAVESGQAERNVRAAPWEVGDAYVKGAKKTMNEPATWNKPPQRQNASKAYESGKGTVHGGASSAKQYEREVQKYNDKQNRGIMKR